MSLVAINAFVIKHIRLVELISVLLRIFSFSLVSWLGPFSPFFFVWTVNVIDAAALSGCAVLKKDVAYILLNVFWVAIGMIGIFRANNVMH